MTGPEDYQAAQTWIEAAAAAFRSSEYDRAQAAGTVAQAYATLAAAAAVQDHQTELDWRKVIKKDP